MSRRYDRYATEENVVLINCSITQITRPPAMQYWDPVPNMPTQMLRRRRPATHPWSATR